MSRCYRIVVLGSGFGGFAAVRRLERLLPPSLAEITVVSPTDHLLYTPLLPEVAGGVLNPRDVAVPLAGALRSPRVPGRAVAADLTRRTVDVDTADGRVRLPWDRLVVATGSVSRRLPIPGLAEHAIGFKTSVEAAHLRDRVLTQLELAAAAGDSRLRAEHATFVVIGAGFAGTELTADLERLSASLVRRNGRAFPPPRWVLVDAGPRVLPELEPALGERATRVLRDRGVEVRLSTTVREVGPRSVTLADGTVVPTRTVVWCAGVVPAPFAAGLGLPLDRGRLVVDPFLRVPGHRRVFALGDAAAVPDLTNPGTMTPPTAQHAVRQGRAVARNVAASLYVGHAAPYRHRDLGLAADLGGWHGVARVLGVPLHGVPARAAARGYHLMALPGNRARVLTSWLLAARRGPQLLGLGLTPADDVVLGAAAEAGMTVGAGGTART
ncbi:MAG TPA: NAD(P)/FAD-dependent oxidoreductase [Kineosporiaceae bacterium]|nr:NAD(P)/FAD-dependent oxidoreductase [Kineosporiaceae bacterium]